MLNYSPPNCFMCMESAADEVLMHRVWLVSCLIVSERGVIRGVGLGRLKIKTCCVHIE